MSDPAGVAARLEALRERIDRAARRAGRDPAAIRVVAASKEVSPDRIRQVLTAGITDIGENRVQELERKIDALADVSPSPRWHLIGSLQRNKASRVAGHVALIHSLDSVALGRALARHARSLGIAQDALLQVNVSGEASKHGVSPADVAPALGALAAEVGLRVRGLMTVAPEGDPAAARACFRALRSLRDDLGDRLAAARGSAAELSMGMSDDFEEAIEEGATIIRLGRALFGRRPGGP